MVGTCSCYSAQTLFGSVREFLEFALPAALAVLPWLIPWLILLVAAYLVLMRPQKRRERAQLLLDVLETAHTSGQSPERAIVALAKSRDLTLGVQFHLLAAYIEAGLSLREALDRVPSFLPEPCAALLKVSSQIPDYRQGLAVCRRSLAGATSRAQGGLNYVLAFPPVVLVLLLIAMFLSTVILPKFLEIFRDLLADKELPWATRWMVEYVTAATIWTALAIITLVVLAGILIFAFRRTRLVKPALDWLWFILPWRRNRLRRDFSGLLGLLLDAGLPEPTALTLAAAGTGNSVFIQRASAAVQRLAGGERLTDAVAALDGSGEFVWRLQNAAHGSGGFEAALAGWHEALEAKAFQQEQAVSQLLSTALVVANGLFVGLIAVALFQVLTTVTGDLGLW